MAEKDYADMIHDVAIAIQGLLRGMAISKVRDIAETCANFKIGKTGETLEERKNQPDYKEAYQNIKEVYSSTNSHEVDDVESELIKKFIFYPNCDNIKDGFTSHSDPMREGAERYVVYVVWNNKKI